MHISEIQSILEGAMPPSTGWQKDRLGIQIEAGTSMSRLFCTMEITDETAIEAVALGADCIITFHPLIFMPLHELRQGERVGRLVMYLLRHNISVISVHTTFDAHPSGTNALLAKALNLCPLEPLVPSLDHAGYGMGLLAELPEAQSGEEFAHRLEGVCGAPVRYTTGRENLVRKVALVGGSGFSYIDAVLASEADAFITADCTYHDFHRVKGKLWLYDVGHYESEKFVTEGLYDIVSTIMQKNDPTLEVFSSKIVPNPVRYSSGDTVSASIDENPKYNNKNDVSLSMKEPK